MPNNDEQLEYLLGELAALKPTPDAAERAVARTREMLLHDELQIPSPKRSLTMTAKLSIAAAAALVLVVGVTGLVWTMIGDGGRQQTNVPPSEERREDDPAPDEHSPSNAESDGEGPIPIESPQPSDGIEVAVETNDGETDNNENEHRKAPVDPDWGHLTGTFTLAGDYAPSPIDVTADRAFCGKHKLVDESVVVDPETRGLKNLIVFLYLKRDDERPKEHPSYAEMQENPVVVDNVGCRFEPHIALVRTGQVLHLMNSDPVGHNARIDAQAKPISPLVPPGAKMEVVFDEPERLPSQISCNIHPWMRGFIVIKDNPYMAVTNSTGDFRIENLPVGKWTFQFWHEQIGYVRDVSVDGKHTEWSRGRVEIEIRPGENDIGKVEVTIDE